MLSCQNWDSTTWVGHLNSLYKVRIKRTCSTVSSYMKRELFPKLLMISWATAICGADMKPLSPSQALGECPQHWLKSHSSLPLKLCHCSERNPTEPKADILAFCSTFVATFVALWTPAGVFGFGSEWYLNLHIWSYLENTLLTYYTN